MNLKKKTCCSAAGKKNRAEREIIIMIKQTDSSGQTVARWVKQQCMTSHTHLKQTHRQFLITEDVPANIMRWTFAQDDTEFCHGFLQRCDRLQLQLCYHWFITLIFFSFQTNRLGWKDVTWLTVWIVTPVFLRSLSSLLRKTGVTVQSVNKPFLTYASVFVILRSHVGKKNSPLFTFHGGRGKSALLPLRSICSLQGDEQNSGKKVQILWYKNLIFSSNWPVVCLIHRAS